MEIMLFSFPILMVLLLIVVVILLGNNDTYVRIFEQRSYRIYTELINTPDDYFIDCSFEAFGKHYYKFQVLDHPTWEIGINVDGKAYVFDGNILIANSFYERGSRKLAEKLLKIK